MSKPGCGVGPIGHPCNRPAVAVVAVHIDPDPWHVRDDRHTGQLLLCQEHQGWIHAAAELVATHPPHIAAAMQELHEARHGR